MECLEEIMKKYFNLLRDHYVGLTQAQEYLHNNPGIFPSHWIWWKLLGMLVITSSVLGQVTPNVALRRFQVKH